MPIYEYRCEECGHTLDVMQRLSDDNLIQCPVCLKPALKKLMSAPSFRLSGAGWYETDFKTGRKRNIAGEDSNADGASETKANQGSEPKSNGAETKTAGVGSAVDSKPKSSAD